MMKSVNATGRQLFPAVADDVFLGLLDLHYTNGLEIAEPLGGSRSPGVRALTYRAYYRQPGGGRRGSCVVKLGHGDAIERDHQGWMNYGKHQPNRDSFAKMDPPLTTEGWGAITIDFVGSEDLMMLSLAEEAPRRPSLLPEAITGLITGVLSSLHEGLCTPGGENPHLVLAQAEALGNWLSPYVLEMAQERMSDEEPYARALRSAMIEEANLIPGLPNYLPQVLRGEGFPQGDVLLRLPLGVVHGDPNFDNIFVASAQDASGLDGLALIDFEWCSEDPPNSPYDDLAKLECELLFGEVKPVDRRGLSCVVALGDRLLRKGPLSAGTEPDRAIFLGLRSIRTQVAHLASLAGPQTPEEELEFFRGYLVTLLGKSIRYLGYEGPSEEARAEALLVCQLLLARLATPEVAEMLPPFTDSPETYSVERATVTAEADSFLLSSEEVGHYAGLVLDKVVAPVGLCATCEIQVTNVSDGGWLMFGLGGEPHAPERTGLGALLRLGGDSRVWTAILSHATSSHSRHGPPFGNLTEIRDTPLVVRLERTSSGLEFGVETKGPLQDINLTVQLPSDAYRGPFALIAHRSTVRVSTLRFHLVH